MGKDACLIPPWGARGRKTCRCSCRVQPKTQSFPPEATWPVQPHVCVLPLALLQRKVEEVTKVCESRRKDQERSFRITFD